LIDPDGKQLGVKPLPEALAIARQMDLDLVEVAPDANPPVTRIMDYNRFKYETAQRAKESRKKATSTSIKEMKYRPKIGSGDFSTKTRQVSRFLEEGHKVKVTIMFRGREVSHPELGMKILDDLAEQVSSVAKVEAAPKLDGRNMVMVLAPDRRARQAARKATDVAQADTATGSEAPPDAAAPPAATAAAATAAATTAAASPAPAAAATPPAATSAAAATAAGSPPSTPRPASTTPPATPAATVTTGAPPAGGDDVEVGTVAPTNGAAAPNREPAKAGMAASAAPRSPA
jgi:translation initiation factor IF-3